MPDTPALQKHFGQPGVQAPGCGFPVMHLLALFHAGTGFLLNVVGAPLRTHDMSRVGQVHPDLAAGDILVGDRGFCSFTHLALLAAQQVFAVFRVHQKQLVDFRPHRRRATRRTRRRGERGLPTSRWLRRLGRHDQLVEYHKPKQRPVWITAEDPTSRRRRVPHHAAWPATSRTTGAVCWSRAILRCRAAIGNLPRSHEHWPGRPAGFAPGA